LRDFCTSRGLAISWLIVGILAFTFQFARNRFSVSQKSLSHGVTAPPGFALREK
jgi:hypothetical protein